MALKLCPNCRLPVHETVAECPNCATRDARSTAAAVGGPLMATIALVATVAVLARRRA